MLEDPQSPTGTTGDETAAPAKKAAAPRTRKTAARTTAKKTAKKAAAEPGSTAPADAAPADAVPADAVPADAAPADAPAAPAKKATAKKAAAKKTTAKAPAKKAAAKKTTAKKSATAPESPESPESPEAPAAGVAAPVFQAPETKTTVTRRTRGSSSSAAAARAADGDTAAPADTGDTAEAPAAAKKTTARRATKKAAASPDAPAEETAAVADAGSDTGSGDSGDDQGGDDSGEGGSRRRRRRGGRRRRKAGDGGDSDAQGEGDEAAEAADTKPAAAKGGQDGRSGAKGGDKAGDKTGDRTGEQDDAEESGEGSSRRRRRRRRSGEDGDEGGAGGGDQQKTSTRARKSRTGEDQITAVSGSTRLEAKKQRRREGREAGRRRAPIVSEAEFLARREAVERVMVIRQREDLIQIGVLEDKVLVEHYVARESQTSLIGNVYLGRVQNVLPSMEAAFIDIGKGRNAVLYAGEVNWSALGHKDGQPRKIESVLSSGQSILVQVTKDPVGHKGARLTSQISLAGRFLVYVPDGTTSGISRKLPDTERNRLKTLLKEIVPDTAGVIVRTAAEGASEDELTRDVERLKARWEDIEKKAKGQGPQLLYGEPDLTLKVVRDLFTEDFAKLVIQGDDAWDTVQGYVAHVAPDLEERLERFEPAANGKDIFAAYRVDEQIAKALDRKVWLPSGGSLVIDRTEAMTVVDVNTGKFTGSGGNLEETVTKNNLEAAEEVVRQLRLRDIGGIIVVDFIDMVLESNRDLVLRRLVECLGRDRTRHQVAEVTSLGLVQMTRKRIGTGLLEAFSENCEHCQGRGVVIHDAPVEPKRSDDDSRRGSSRRSRGGRGRDGDGGSDAGSGGNGGNGKPPTPKDVAAMAQPPKDEKADRADQNDQADQGEKAEKAEKPDAGSEEQPDRAPAEQPAEQAPEEETPAPAAPVDETPAETPAEPTEQPGPAAEPPKVVTRTRRRSASRPAGPPASSGAALPSAAGVGAVGAPAATGLVEPGTADAEPGAAEPPQVEHVPIKKRGSRKR